MPDEKTNGTSSSVIVISGANGAGKSTLAPFLLRDELKIFDYVNADTIAEGLSAFAPERAALQAGRIMLRRLHELAAENQSFAFETTLASRSCKQFLYGLQVKSYQFHLIFLFLQSADLAVERVRARVRLGGHNVPQEQSGDVIKTACETFLSFINRSLILGDFMKFPRKYRSK